MLWTFSTQPGPDFANAMCKRLLDDLVGFKETPMGTSTVGGTVVGRRQLRWRTNLALGPAEHRVELRGWIRRKWRIRWLDEEPTDWTVHRSRWAPQLTLRHPQHPSLQISLWGSDADPNGVMTRIEGALGESFAPTRKLSDRLELKPVKY